MILLIKRYFKIFENKIVSVFYYFYVMYYILVHAQIMFLNLFFKIKQL